MVRLHPASQIVPTEQMLAAVPSRRARVALHVGAAVGMHPVNYFDPDGNFIIPILVGAAAGGAEVGTLGMSTTR